MTALTVESVLAMYRVVVLPIEETDGAWDPLAVASGSLLERERDVVCGSRHLCSLTVGSLRLKTSTKPASAVLSISAP